MQLLATLVQNELNSYVACFTTNHSNLSFNESVCSRLRRLFQKEEISSTFASKSVHVARFAAQSKLVLQQVTEVT